MEALMLLRKNNSITLMDLASYYLSLFKKFKKKSYFSAFFKFSFPLLDYMSDLTLTVSR
jgi:hypothetical protein